MCDPASVGRIFLMRQISNKGGACARGACKSNRSPDETRRAARVAVTTQCITNEPVMPAVLASSFLRGCEFFDICALVFCPDGHQSSLRPIGFTTHKRW